MAIDFFKTACKSKTREKSFGIYDAPPATLSFKDQENWTLHVENTSEKEITHIAIDGCLDIPETEGERCESMLIYDDVLTFIELKDRDGGRWAGKARDQLKNTITLFTRDADVTAYRRRYGQIANKQRPHFKAGGKSFSEQFKQETGFVLRVGCKLQIE